MKRGTTFLYWAPRVLAIIFILFVSVFALDVFGEGYGFWKTVGAFLLHLVPTYFLVGVLLIALKWEHIGGLIFIALGLLYIILTWERGTIVVYAVMSGPAFVIGILFLIQRVYRERHKEIL